MGQALGKRGVVPPDKVVDAHNVHLECQAQDVVMQPQRLSSRGVMKRRSAGEAEEGLAAPGPDSRTAGRGGKCQRTGHHAAVAVVEAPPHPRPGSSKPELPSATARVGGWGWKARLGFRCLNRV